jgi:acyl transferase domain-containing protein
MSNPKMDEYLNAIAIIGMEGRFPGARNIGEYWKNLRNGIHAVSFFSDEEIELVTGDRSELGQPNYVKAGGILDDIELFDASFFGFTPREAEITNPQHRLFLECAWAALESAGYDPESYKGRIGVYAGSGLNNYLLHVLSNRGRLALISDFQAVIGNEKDHLPTQVSYKLNLKGPSINCQTTCSTSLVAVSMACQSLLDFHCDMALAGGVSIRLPQKEGYRYEDGGIDSPDGYCRAFDAKAQGTVGGNGVGIVVLKRMVDAVSDGDCIHAMIKGFAINNDGSEKVGYTAPSLNGQAEVILEALAMAGVSSETISYVEAHGTGTALGDPIEIAALTKAFRASTDRRGFCAIGSVKTNIGHLNTAAGIAGLIKTVLALKNKTLLPSLHFEQANPKIDFASSPFYVNTRLKEWVRNGTPRRAGVSSFGIGGTNTHVIVEEAAARESAPSSRPGSLLVLSARTELALEKMTVELVEFLRRHEDVNLADAAYTLQVGRGAFNHRRAVVCLDTADAIDALEACHSQRVSTGFSAKSDSPVTMMFSGQGTQYADMGRDLYSVEPYFRHEIDCCAEILKSHLGYDLRDALYHSPQQTSVPLPDLNQTCVAQPALFTIEYALAKLWVAWGFQPESMIGHSIGEYVAACLAGVMSLVDALSLVAARGNLIQQLPGGAMLALLLPEAEVRQILEQNERLSLAAINGPQLCVVSGPTDAVAQLELWCKEQGIDLRRLRTSHAFHSEMMDGVMDAFTERVRKVSLKPPHTPFISNVTGTWITAAQATDPSYWASHLRQTVLFRDGISELLKNPERIILEVGPGETLSTAVKQTPQAAGRLVLTSLHPPRHQQSDSIFLLNTLRKLWVAGKQVDWTAFHAHEHRCRTVLPTYPFERQRYWLDLNLRAFGASELRVEAAEHESKELIGVQLGAGASVGLSEGVNSAVVSGPVPPPPSHPPAYAAPTNPIEQTIAEIWQELFGVERIGIHDNFFELDGNSLLGIQLMSRMRKVFMSEIPMNSLFESPTIAGLASVVSEIYPEQNGSEELGQMLAEIEKLSAEEIELRLNQG